MRKKNKFALALGSILLSFTCFQKAATAAPAKEAFSGTTISPTTISTTTATLSSPGSSTTKPLSPPDPIASASVNDEQECWNLVPKRYKDNNGQDIHGCPSTSIIVPNFIMTCAARKNLSCKLLDAEQVDDLGLEINSLQENTILVVKYDYKESLPKDDRVYHFAQLSPFYDVLANLFRMRKANLVRMAAVQQQLTSQDDLPEKRSKKCLPVKTPVHLKKNNVLIGVVTDHNGNNLGDAPYSSAYEEELKVPICDEMGLEYHHTPLISIGTEDDLSNVSMKDKNPVEPLNIPDVGITHISGFKFLPRQQEILVPEQSYLGIQTPYVKINCFDGGVRLHNNSFLLTDRTAVSMQCNRKKGFWLVEDDTEPYDKFSSNFVFVDNNIHGMKGYLNIGLSIVTDGFHVRRPLNDYWRHLGYLTSIHQNTFLGEMTYAIKISTKDPFFSSRHSVKYNTISGYAQGDMENGILLSGPPVYLFEKSKHKSLTTFQTKGNDINTVGSMFVLDGMQTISMTSMRGSARHLVSHVCSIYSESECKLYNGKPPIFLYPERSDCNSVDCNRLYIEDEFFMASHMYYGKIRFTRSDTGNDCTFPDPCPRETQKAEEK